VLFNNREVEKASSTFKKSEEIYITLEEDDIEPEMMSQRSAIAKALNIPINE
jgi:hypothetical protein